MIVILEHYRHARRLGEDARLIFLPRVPHISSAPLLMLGRVRGALAGRALPLRGIPLKILEISPEFWNSEIKQNSGNFTEILEISPEKFPVFPEFLFTIYRNSGNFIW